MTEIVKVQQPLFPANAPAMIYDRAREHTTFQRLPDRVLRKLKDAPKGYFHATWNDGQWELAERAEAALRELGEWNDVVSS